MILVYLIDTDTVVMIPASAIPAEHVPTYETDIGAEVSAARDRALTSWLLTEVGTGGLLTKRCSHDMEFRVRARGARKIAADLTVAAAALPNAISVKNEADESPMSKLKREHREELRQKDSELLLARVQRQKATRARKKAVPRIKKEITTQRRVSTRKKKVINYVERDEDSDYYPPLPDTPGAKPAAKPETPTTDELMAKLMRRREHKRRMCDAYYDKPRGRMKQTARKLPKGLLGRPMSHIPEQTGGIKNPVSAEEYQRIQREQNSCTETQSYHDMGRYMQQQQQQYVATPPPQQQQQQYAQMPPLQPQQQQFTSTTLGRHPPPPPPLPIQQQQHMYSTALDNYSDADWRLNGTLGWQQ